jgi:glycosyltransferase involved in cell wall biosynthesis
LPHPNIKPLIEKAHLFVLPTLGESFGHAIFEALAVGCPVLISNQTPWINLAEQKAGCELPIEKSLFLEKLNEFQAMGNETWQQYRQGARSVAESYIRQANFFEKYENLFHL